VQRGYELALSRPDGQHCPECVGAVYFSHWAGGLIIYH